MTTIIQELRTAQRLRDAQEVYRIATETVERIIARKRARRAQQRWSWKYE